MHAVEQIAGKAKRGLLLLRTPDLQRSALCLILLTVVVPKARAAVTFTNAARLSVEVGSDSPQAIALADVNKDNRPDIIAVSQDTDQVNIFPNDGFGGFGGGPNPFNVGAGPTAVGVGDFDRDGNLDIVTVNIDSNTVTVLFGDGTGSFNAGRQDYPVNDTPVAVAVADYNNDLRPDLAVLDDNSVYLLMSNGDRTSTPGSPASIATRSFGGTAIATGLFNTDNFPDLVVSNRDSGTVSVFLGNGNGTFKAATLLNVGTGPNGIVTGDWNGDSKTDIAVVDSFEIADLNVSLLFGHGDGTFQNEERTTAEVSSVAIATADLDSNGKLDFAVTNASGQDNTVNVLLYDPSAINAESGFALQELIPGLQLGQGQVAVQAGDLNADGRPDLIALGEDVGTIGVFINTSGQLTTATPTATPTGTPSPPPQPGTCPEQDLGSAVPQTVNGSTVGGPHSSGGACGGGAAPESTFLYTAPTDGTYIFDTTGSALDTVLSVRAEVCRGAELGCNDDAGSTDHASRVTLPLLAGQRIVIVVDGFSGKSGSFALHISRLTPPPTPGGNCPEQDLGSTVPQTVSGSTVGGSPSLGGVCGGAGAPQRTFLYTAPAGGTYTFDTIGSEFDTVLSVRADTCDGPELACADDINFNDPASRVTVVLAAGQRVVILVAGFVDPVFGASSGNFILHIAASAEGPLTNGSFEENRGVGSDAFNNWTGGGSFSGSWFVQSGTTTPSSGFTVPAPPAGNFAAMTDQGGPGQHILFQNFTVPGAGGTLSCLAFVRSSAEFVLPEPETLDPFGSGENQQVRIDIMNPNSAVDDVSAGVLRNLFLTHAGDPGSPANPMSSYATITTPLDAFAGQRVRLRFAEVDNLGFLNFGVDNCTISAAPQCVGDCNGDGAVQPDEIIVLVNIALGSADLSVCPAGDPDGTGTITIVSLVQAVHSALSGCGATVAASSGPLSFKSKLSVAAATQSNSPAKRRPYRRHEGVY